jgi:hypothetical protein
MTSGLESKRSQTAFWVFVRVAALLLAATLSGGPGRAQMRTEPPPGPATVVHPAVSIHGDRSTPPPPPPLDSLGTFPLIPPHGLAK